MQRLFVGTYAASISSPMEVTRANRQAYARSFLDQLERRLAAARHPAVRFELVWWDSGCIKFKARVFLELTIGTTVAVVASAVVLQNTAALTAFQLLAAKGQAQWECKINDKDWACNVLRSEFRLASKFYFTGSGDTLDNVIRDVWRVPATEHSRVAKAMTKVYQGLIEDDVTKRLKPDVFIALITPEMVREKK